MVAFFWPLSSPGIPRLTALKAPSARPLAPGAKGGGCGGVYTFGLLRGAAFEFRLFRWKMVQNW